MGYDIDFDRLMQLANFTLPSVEDDAPLIKVPIYKNIVDMRLSAVTSDFRMYKQDTVSKNAMLLEVSDSTLNTFKAISLLLLEPFQGVLNNELALFIIDNKMIIGCMHMDNDGKQIIQRIDSKNEQIIYQDKLEIWRIVEIIHLVGQGESKGI
ncbi:HTH motif/peptidase domain protein [Listeria weihenstephanensis FSL R9-0317]|nr:XRE family transcriptional regulator [Listeria weihenstephanensis]EUJ41476.1 HTH motif/peptidase domain protein [Listeria weihenstephanensis FSL R9-0317]